MAHHGYGVNGLDSLAFRTRVVARGEPWDCKVPAINVQRFPEDLSFEEAACLPLAGYTAWHCLMVRAQFQPSTDVTAVSC